MVDFLNLSSPMLPAFGPLAGAAIGQFSMAPLERDVLSAINRHTPVDVVETASDEDGTWFRFRSDVRTDGEVYQRLSKNWVAIGGRNGLEFSLIYCLSGQGAGVWLCHRSVASNTRFSQGCQQIISW
jgi:hypothetical protein